MAEEAVGGSRVRCPLLSPSRCLNTLMATVRWPPPRSLFTSPPFFGAWRVLLYLPSTSDGKGEWAPTTFLCRTSAKLPLVNLSPLYALTLCKVLGSEKESWLPLVAGSWASGSGWQSWQGSKLPVRGSGGQRVALSVPSRRMVSSTPPSTSVCM